MTQPQHDTLATILDNAEQVYAEVRALHQTHGLPLSAVAREHFNHDMPALVFSVKVLQNLKAATDRQLTTVQAIDQAREIAWHQAFEVIRRAAIHELDVLRAQHEVLRAQLNVAKRSLHATQQMLGVASTGISTEVDDLREENLRLADELNTAREELSQLGEATAGHGEPTEPVADPRITGRMARLHQRDAGPSMPVIGGVRPSPTGYDPNPTVFGNDPQAYAKYARDLDGWKPGWHEDDETRMAAGLAAQAIARRNVQEGDRG